MDRRKFIKGAGVAGVAAASTLAAPAIAQGTRELKMVTTWPKNFPGLGTGAQRVADRISKITDGSLTVRLFAAGELVPPFESFDAVSTGSADMYHAADYYWQGKSKAYAYFTAVPFGMTAAEIHAWIHHMGGQELWDELGSQFNLKHLPAGNTGVQMGGWFNKEINSIDDMKGLKIRMPGLGGEVLRRIGAAAVTLPGGEIFPSLQSGAIDATEWVGPWNDLAFGFYKVTKYYYYPGFHEPGAMLGVGINLDVWNSLSGAHQEAIRASCIAENDIMLGEFNANNGRALKTLLNDHGVELRRFDDSIFTEIAAKSKEVLAEAGASSEIAGKVHASFTESFEALRSWTGLSEQPYTAVRDKAFGG